MATLVLNTALPLLPQVEVKVTFCGVVTATPPLCTVTETLVVPNADNGFTPTAGVLMVTADAPTAKPRDPVTAVGGLPICAVAVIVVAPDASPTAFSVTVATPAELVNAVGAGVSVASVASVANVTTEFGTTAPLASLKVALTVPGAALDMEVTADPPEPVRASVSVGTGVVDAVVVVVVVPAVPAAEVLDSPPPPQPPSAPSMAARDNDATSLETRGRNKEKVEKVCTQASQVVTRPGNPLPAPMTLPV